MGHTEEPATEAEAGTGRAALVAGDVEFEAADAELLRTIERTGSVAAAARDLGRSRARATWRIETLEAAFGSLVDRNRGGDGGGGSELTERAVALLQRYDRLAVAIEATARIPETVLTGTVQAIDGELATVATPIGPVHGLHDALAVDDPVQVRIGGDAITIHEATGAGRPDASSARNLRRGRVTEIDRGDTVGTVTITVDEVQFQALITAASESRLGLALADAVRISWKATATRLIRGSSVQHGAGDRDRS